MSQTEFIPEDSSWCQGVVWTNPGVYIENIYAARACVFSISVCMPYTHAEICLPWQPIQRQPRVRSWIARGL